MNRLTDQAIIKLCHDVQIGTGGMDQTDALNVVIEWLENAWVPVTQELPADDRDGKPFLTYAADWGYSIEIYNIKGTYRGFDWAGGCVPDRVTEFWREIPLVAPPPSVSGRKGD